jgi:hypothetical protein
MPNAFSKATGLLRATFANLILVTVVLAHGDTESRKWFEAQIHQRYPKIKVVQPTPGLPFEL